MKLTVAHQDQGALGFGLAVVDLEGVRALAGSGEVIHRHLDDSRGHVVADLVSLGERFTLKLPPTDDTITVCDDIRHIAGSRTKGNDLVAQ